MTKTANKFNQWDELELLFLNFPLLSNFKFDASITNPNPFKKVVYQDAYGKDVDWESRKQIFKTLQSTPWGKKDENARLFLLCENSLERFIKNVLVDEPKYRKYMASLLTDLDSLIKIAPYLIEVSCLLKCDLNKEIIFNALETFTPKYLNQGMILENVATPNLIRKLASFYSAERMCELILDGRRASSEIRYGRPNQIQEANDLLRTMESLEDMGVDLEETMPKTPKSLQELHNWVFDFIEEQRRLEGLVDFDLNPAPHLLKLNNQTIEVNGEKLHAVVPQTLFELIPFSRKNMFNNCVGKSNHYAEGVRDGKWTIVGLFTSDYKARYCLQIEPSGISQAKGVANSSVPQAVFVELERALKPKPQKPKKVKELKALP